MLDTPPASTLAANCRKLLISETTGTIDTLQHQLKRISHSCNKMLPGNLSQGDYILLVRSSPVSSPLSSIQLGQRPFYFVLRNFSLAIVNVHKRPLNLINCFDLHHQYLSNRHHQRHSKTSSPQQALPYVAVLKKGRVIPVLSCRGAV